MSAPTPVALVDDDADLRAATAQLLLLDGYQVRQFADAPTALKAIDADFPGVVVTDIRMPGMSGIELFRTLSGRDAELPVILITGHGDVDTAVAALKAGAWDFLGKPFAPDALLAAVARAATARALTVENRRLRALAQGTLADELVGHSSAIQRLRQTLPILAEADLDVVVEGATGTGKHLLAQLIHRASRRARGRFVAVDCAALPPAVEDALLDAFGTVAGAHGGTLFLDHLDRASEALQHRLARFVENRLVALDARAPDRIDARIVAAIDDGARARVLPALFHRLAAVSLRLPPLAERGEDVPLLLMHFLTAQATQRGQAVPTLAEVAHLAGRRDWPGNVRELEMAAERFLLGLDEQASEPVAAPLPERVRAFERALIEEAVARAGGEIARAVDALGVPRETFYYRVKRLGIDLKRLRSNAGAP